MIVTRAPLRVSFIGGGTDYPEFFEQDPGIVLGATINKYVYVNILKLSDDARENYRFTYRKTESVEDFKDFEHPVVRETLRDMKWKEHLNIATMADLPGNSGLGSSSSFAVALILGLNAYRSDKIPPSGLADTAVRIEREILKEPGGWQDQYHAAVGGFRKYLFSNSGVEFSEPLLNSDQLNSLCGYFYLVKVGKERASAIQAFQNISSGKADNGKILLAQLREATRDFESQLKQPNLSTNSIVAILCEAINVSYKLKKELTRDEYMELDQIIDTARLNGALAGKICGAGRSGYALLVIPPNDLSRVKIKLPDLNLIPIDFVEFGAQILVSGA